MSFKKTIALIAITVLLSFGETTSAQTTATDLRLTSSPLPINLKVIPGTTVSANIKVKNDGISAENIRITLMKFKADSATGAPNLSERQAGDDYFDWVTFSEDKFVLPVNEWKTITATFNVPASASFGYYYAVVFTRAQENVTQSEKQTILVGGMATLVLLEAQVPNAKREIQVTDFSVDKSMFEFLPATFSIKLKNTGNVHLAPRGNIFISKSDQKDVAILEVNPNKGSILPDSPRTFEESWSDGFPYYIDKQADGKVVIDGNGKTEQELKWNFAEASKLRWGKYTAKMLLVYDDGKRDVPVEAEVSFWIMPWRVIIYAVLIPLIPALSVYFFMKWRMKKAMNRGKKNKKK
ncbi:MAG: hypothetical protein HGA36_01225 [Candidatus Moranbacteria bacterium]|nr:hypothetical protein [Candidatus Moranbacteria bacterium]